MSKETPGDMDLQTELYLLHNSFIKLPLESKFLTSK